MKKELGFLAQHPWAILILSALTLVTIPVYLSSRMMKTHPMTETEVSAASPGTKIEVVLEVTATRSEQSFQGVLLERQSSGSYERTKRSFSVTWSPENTPLVMGKKSDVRTGAVVQVNGKSRSDGGIVADRIVILTGYVKLS